MVVIFGWGEGRAQDMGEIAPVVCPNCHNQVFLHRVRSEKRVSLYFVPLVPYGTNEYLVCPICRNGMELRPEHRAAVERMRAETSMFRRGSLEQDYYKSRVREFWAEVGIGPSGEQVVHPASVVPPPAIASRGQPPAASRGTPEPPLAERLRGLAALHADGVLTDDEFAAAKRRLLGI